MSDKHTPEPCAARKEFEAWAKTTSLKNFLFWHPSDNQYEVHAVQMAFEGYRAAAAQRGALVAQMLEALSTVGTHTITDEDGDEIEVLYGDIEMIQDVIAAARGEQ